MHRENSDGVHDPTCRNFIQKGERMLINAQIQFTRQEIVQFDELLRQTGATRTKLVRRAVDYYIRGIREHGVQVALLPLQTDVASEARQEQKVGPSLESSYVNWQESRRMSPPESTKTR